MGNIRGIICTKTFYGKNRRDVQSEKCISFSIIEHRPIIDLISRGDETDSSFMLATCMLQVWSLSPFNVSCQLLTNDFNQVSSISLLMTSSTALANEGLFELTRRPSLTRAVLLPLAETTEEPG